MDVRKRGDAQTSFERGSARDEDAPGVAIGVVVTVFAPSRVLSLFKFLARGDHPSVFGDRDHRRDAVVVLEVQALRQIFFAIDLHMRHATEFFDQTGVVVAAIDHQHRGPISDAYRREIDVVFEKYVVLRTRRYAAVIGNDHNVDLVVSAARLKAGDEFAYGGIEFFDRGHLLWRPRPMVVAGVIHILKVKGEELGSI